MSSQDVYLRVSDEWVFIRARYPGEEAQNMGLNKPLGYEIRVEGGYYDETTGFYTFEGKRMRYLMNAEGPSHDLTVATAHGDEGEMLGRVVLVPRRNA